jgi:hypothetical protein
MAFTGSMARYAALYSSPANAMTLISEQKNHGYNNCSCN